MQYNTVNNIIPNYTVKNYTPLTQAPSSHCPVDNISKDGQKQPSGSKVMVKTVWWAKHSGQHKCTFKATMSTQVYFNLRAQDKAKRQKTSHEQFKSSKVAQRQ